jgi:hypothetical protein
MKIALKCNSLLLEKALKKFLSQYIVSEEKANILITDNKIESSLPIFRIGYNDSSADLQKPFSRSQLMIKLEEKLNTIKQKEELATTIMTDDDSIENEIEKLTKQFVKDLLKIFKKYSDKDNLE